MELAIQTASIVLQFVAIVIVVDFVGGFIHWAEDTFWSPDTPIVGRWLVAPNVIHHTPAGGNHFLRNHWAFSSWDLITAAIVGVGGGYLLGIDLWQFYAFIAVGLFSQQVHRFSHSKTNPTVVVALQKMRIIQDGKHHWHHHRGDKNTHYCVITPWVNPVLDRLGFWRALERILVPVLGSARRADIHRKNWYTGPIAAPPSSTEQVL